MPPETDRSALTRKRLASSFWVAKDALDSGQARVEEEIAIATGVIKNQIGHLASKMTDQIPAVLVVDCREGGRGDCSCRVIEYHPGTNKLWSFIIEFTDEPRIILSEELPQTDWLQYGEKVFGLLEAAVAKIEKGEDVSFMSTAEINGKKCDLRKPDIINLPQPGLSARRN